MPLTMTCPKCGGEIEWDSEEADSGDGVWAQSYRVGFVLYEEVRLTDPLPERNFQTSCGCRWTGTEIDELDERASELACEVSEP